MKTYRKLSLKSLLLYAISFVWGVLVGWWVKPKGKKIDCDKSTHIPPKDVKKIKLRLAESAEQKEIETVNLCDVTDAMIWVDEWARIIKENPKIPTDQGTMLSWFANAIMAGYDHAVRQYETEPKRAEPCQEQKEVNTRPPIRYVAKFTAPIDTTSTIGLADTQPIKVRYTAEQIMPKRYPGQLPKYSGSTWVLRNHEPFEWIKVGVNKGYEGYKGFTWFIDVPAAPPELKPVKGEPKENGIYVCHHKETGVWHTLKWDGKFWYINYRDDYVMIDVMTDDIDWFIPYRISSAEGEK